MPPHVVAEMVELALQYDVTYDVHLSGGVHDDLEQNENYYSRIARLIHNKHPTTMISLETTPPLTADGLQKYKESGISSLIMNLEIADEVVRRRICPGKSTISLERYFEAYEEGVNVFGRWNVASVLLWGIEGVSKEQVINCVERMCSIGVYPVIMPFQPLKGSALQQARPTDANEFLKISQEVGSIIAKSLKDQSVCKFGCIHCGACSIENNFLKEISHEHLNH